MTARSTRLREYVCGEESVFASKITDIQPCNLRPGAMTLFFNKVSGPSQSHLIPEWVEFHKPEVGGYFVVYDEPDGTTRCKYMRAADFEGRYK